MKFRNTFGTSHVSSEKQQLLETFILHENIKRCKLFAKIVILFEFILIIMNFSATQGEFKLNTYLVLYLVLLIMSIVMLVFLSRFERKTTYTEQQYKRFQIRLFCFVNFFLIWGAVVTLFDQSEYGHVMAFAVNLMCVSVLFHMSNRTNFFMYILPISVLVVGLPIFQPSSAVVMGHFINLSVFLFFCWLASRMLYQGVVTNFFNKLLLTETNQNLAVKIEENEKINRELAVANEQLKRMAIIDELTNILNRRGFQKYIQKTLPDTTEKRKVSVMMIDIDAFKLFNDNYGHIKGDKVINSVAQTIQTCMDSARSITARFGGEEFVVATFDLGDEEIYRLAENIRLAVIEMHILHEFSPAANHVTVSIGLASGLFSTEAEIEQLMENADSALYLSKSKGRNRVEFFE